MTKKLKEDDGLEISCRNPGDRDHMEDALVRDNQKLFLRNQHLQTWLVVLSVCALLIGWLLGTFKPIPILNQVREVQTVVVKESSKAKIDNIMRIMENYWYFAKGIDNLDERLTDQALMGITTNEEDKHTTYMSREEIEAFTQYINRNFVGIGVQFQSQEDGLHLITRVFRDSPAEKAGVQAGDIIHSVNGEIVDNYTADKIKELVQGEEGTDVTIGLVREGKTISVDITRGQIGHTVDGTITEEGIGYLSIEPRRALKKYGFPFRQSLGIPLTDSVVSVRRAK